MPMNYFYDKTSDIDKSSIMVKGKSIDWSSEHGESLQNSIVLSEIEQVFGISAAILERNTHKVMITSFYPAFCLYSVYTTGIFVNQKMNLYIKPLSVSERESICGTSAR